MKLKIVFLFMLFSCFLLNGQEIKLKSAVLASGGTNAESNTINISKWRLGEVHLVVLQRNQSEALAEANWKVSSYPNPFAKNLNLAFKTEGPMEFTIQLTDITGRKIWLSEKKKIIPNQLVNLDLVWLSSGMYLLSITPKDRKTQSLIKVQKH